MTDKIPTVRSGLDTIDSDTEAEFELEIAQRMIDKGKQAFTSSDYQKAVGFMQKGVATYNRLPHNLKSKLDLTDVPLTIATCKFHLNEIDEATKDLTKLMHAESSSDQDAIRKCQVSYLLSQIHLIKNDLDVAEKYCRQSLFGRKRLLGKDHQEWYKSLALLVEICLLSDKSEEAAVMRDMLPQGFEKSAEMLHLQNLKELQTHTQSFGESGLKLRLSTMESHATSASYGISSPHTTPTPHATSTPHANQKQSEDTPSVWSLTGVRSHRSVLQKLVRCHDHCHGLQIAFSLTGSLLALVSDSDGARVWNVTTDKEVSRLEKHTGAIYVAAISPSGSQLASGSTDGTIRVWDLLSGRETKTLPGDPGLGNRFTHLAFSHDELTLASRAPSGSLKLWNLRASRGAVDLGTYLYPGHSPIVFSPTGSMLAWTTERETITILWDVKRNVKMYELSRHDKPIRELAFSPNSLLLASTSDDATVRLWDVQTGECLAIMEHEVVASCVTFTPDSSLLISGTWSRGDIYLWDTATGKEMRESRIAGRHEGFVSQIRVSPDGTLLACALDHKIVRVWGLTSEPESSFPSPKTSTIPLFGPLRPPPRSPSNPVPNSKSTAKDGGHPVFELNPNDPQEPVKLSNPSANTTNLPDQSTYLSWQNEFEPRFADYRPSPKTDVIFDNPRPVGPSGVRKKRRKPQTQTHPPVSPDAPITDEADAKATKTTTPTPNFLGMSGARDYISSHSGSSRGPQNIDPKSPDFMNNHDLVPMPFMRVP